MRYCWSYPFFLWLSDMKKLILFLLLLFFMTGCEKSLAARLEDLSYTKEEIGLIEALCEDHRLLFLEEKNERALAYLHTAGFEDEHLDDYLKYDKMAGEEKVVRLVNEGKLNDADRGKIEKMFTDIGYIEKNEDLYFEYLDCYDSMREVIEAVNALRYRELYTEIQPVDMSKGDLILVNKYHQLDESYVPDDLIAFDSPMGKGRLREKVYDAYKELYRAAKEDGYTLVVVSSYRSFSYQDGLYRRYLSRDTKENVDTYSARPGHSEHQTGMAIDVSLPGVSLDDFGSTNAAEWLKQHGADYGFIIRYPKDRIDVTGYIEEPWHIRYLGKEVAEDVLAKGMTYDEYYACYVE